MSQALSLINQPHMQPRERFFKALCAERFFKNLKHTNEPQIAKIEKFNTSAPVLIHLRSILEHRQNKKSQIGVSCSISISKETESIEIPGHKQLPIFLSSTEQVTKGRAEIF